MGLGNGRLEAARDTPSIIFGIAIKLVRVVIWHAAEGYSNPKERQGSSQLLEVGAGSMKCD